MNIEKYSAYLKIIIYKIFTHPKYLFLFKKIGAKSMVIKPMEISGYKRISIGNHVRIGYKGWLASMPLTNNANPELSIGDGCKIGNFNHIYCTSRITLGRNVLTADKVYISDNSHAYQNIEIPIWQQPIIQLNEVNIGDSSWIGENVCIIGANIGKHCIIGANSVVRSNIPDYCVAVGTPARIIKRYCSLNQKWLNTDSEGNFIN